MLRCSLNRVQFSKYLLNRPVGEGYDIADVGLMAVEDCKARLDTQQNYNSMQTGPSLPLSDNLQGVSKFY